MFTPLWLVPLTLAVAVPGPDYALAPGFERLYARVAQPAPGELPDGLVLARVSVPVDHVEALYAPRGAAVSSCEAAPLCLTLRHPSTSQPGDLPAGPYVVRVTGAAAPAPRARRRRRLAPRGRSGARPMARGQTQAAAPRRPARPQRRRPLAG